MNARVETALSATLLVVVGLVLGFDFGYALARGRVEAAAECRLGDERCDGPYLERCEVVGAGFDGTRLAWRRAYDCSARGGRCSENPVDDPLLRLGYPRCILSRPWEPR